MSQDELLAAVRRRYLNSGDFNGFHLHGTLLDSSRADAIALVEANLVELVSEKDYLNPHIRPWASKRSLQEQVRELSEYPIDGYGVCLYPTAAGMRGVRLPGRYRDHPYRQAMARGRATLELAYFSMDVLEPYRNDPRYSFTFGDFSAYMSISDEAYTDKEELEQDKVSLSHIGFAYDLTAYDPDDVTSRITRRVTVFYGDLAKLTPEHQQRWRTYEVAAEGLEPHPAWWMSQMGHWRDRLGPLERFFQTLEELNELTTRAFAEPMLATVERPESFGWLLRPAQRDWDEFVLQFDKLLSENLRHKFFDAVGTPAMDERNQRAGTISRLGTFMRSHGAPSDRVSNLLKPIRDVRNARQKPAHALRVNVTDKTFIHKQLAMVADVSGALMAFRSWIATHPANADWKPSYDDAGTYRI